jgi:hypothetical protein
MVRKLFTSSLVVIASAFIALPTVALPDSGIPIIITTGSSFTSGQQAMLTLTQSSATSTNLYYSISATPSSDFSSVPTQVEVPAGQTSTNFYVTLSGSASGSIQIGASGNGESASVQETVEPD